MKLVFIACALFLTGCVSFNRGGTTHHVILGFGIVSVNSTNRAVADVIKTQVIGLGFNDSGAGAHFDLGYGCTTVVKVVTNQNIVIEVSDVPGKPLTVNVPK